MSLPESKKHPVTEFPLESYIQLTLNDPDHKNSRTAMRGLHNQLLAGDIVTGNRYKMSDKETRTVVYAYSYDIIFYVDNEEKLFRQDVVGFSLDIQFSAFVIGGQKSIGTVYFANIVMGLIGAGFAVTSFPAFILVFTTDIAQGVDEVKNDPVSMAIIKFVSTYVGIHSVLSRVAPVLSDKLFYYLLKKALRNVGEELDPEAVMKILVTLIATVVKKKLKISNRIKKAQNRLSRKALVFQIVMAFAKLIWQVLKVLPASIYKTGSTLETNARKMAINLGTEFRKVGVDVSQEDFGKIIKEFENIIVLEKIIELREAAKEVTNALAEAR